MPPNAVFAYYKSVMNPFRNARVGMAALAMLASPAAGWAGDDLPFAYVGPNLPSLAEYVVAGDNSGVLETDATRFLNETARFQWEVAELSQIALTQTECTRVRRFAAGLIRSHAAMYGELSRLAEHKGLHLAGPPEFDRGEWVRKSPEEFERDYLARISELHAAAIEKFGNAAQESADEEIAAYAAKHLSTLQQHERRAGELAARRGEFETEPAP